MLKVDTKPNVEEPEMLEEYDFSKGVRGKYARLSADGTNVVLIDSDLVEFFPDSEKVNAALRSLVEIARTTVKRS
ncbi:MAG: hypothetical protein O3A46_02360 [Candidatus Poribacteria bacterium]|nr:hypothetical protein [Candidatus Poribacteria bacterium]